MREFSLSDAISEISDSVIFFCTENTKIPIFTSDFDFKPTLGKKVPAILQGTDQKKRDELHALAKSVHVEEVISFARMIVGYKTAAASVKHAMGKKIYEKYIVGTQSAGEIAGGALPSMVYVSNSERDAIERVFNGPATVVPPDDIFDRALEEVCNSNAFVNMRFEF
jgi:hypothetical protein